MTAITSFPLPDLSSSLEAILTEVQHIDIIDQTYGWSGTKEVWHGRPLSRDERHNALHYLQHINQILQPAPPTGRLSRIYTLLAHYPNPGLAPEIEQAIAQDWADDLAEFPQWCLDKACQMWRRDQKRYRFRPLPGDIRQLCLEVVGDLLKIQSRLKILLQPAEKKTALEQILQNSLRSFSDGYPAPSATSQRASPRQTRPTSTLSTRRQMSQV